ncbi:MAG: hypothetical protein KDA44_15905 [Planctomycetales bacterium]|nr:hypothetical protein [Planctomycetales bacterium]
MRRRAENDEGMPGEDSFLDIIANMVGILIILVMVVGVRAGKASLAKHEQPMTEESAGPSLAEVTTKVREVQHDLTRRERDVEATVTRVANAWRECKLVDQRRVELEMVRAEAERELAARRGQLDEGRQREFDVQRQIVEAQIRLNELTQEQMQLISQPLDVEEVESTPTPIAKSDAVNDDAIHLRLRDGLVSVVPVAALQQEVYRTQGVEYLRRELNSRNQAADVYGPIDGFRMRLRVERYATAMPGSSPLAPQPRARNVVRGVFLPEASEMGQPLEQAMMPGTALMRALRSRPSNTTAVVAWVYPDSYDELRALKRMLWEQGIPLAVWPLHKDQQIEFSSEGTKAAAQ